MKSLNQPPFNKERKQTDDSLTDERGKTDESFNNYRDKAESETDKVVSANRLEADMARSKRRSEADGRHSNAGNSNDLRLANERNLEDTAIKKERHKNDLAIELERGKKEKILNTLFGLEREATDKNLFGERAKTDLDVEEAAKILNLEQAAHLDTKSALTTREEFVAIVSHDLRNPIGAILSSVDVLMDEVLVKGLGEDAKRWLDVIKRNAETSLRLIGDILDMERIVGGKLQLQMSLCLLGDLIREVVESFLPAAAAKKIQLKVLFIKPDISIDCDRDRVFQILLNLIGNAIKFTPQGGTIKITTDASAKDIKVSIKDTGPGIPLDQQQMIFERFAQIGNKNRSGIGLGLYISKTLVDSHHGKIWVSSSDGLGSEFSFTLPKCSTLRSIIEIL